MDLLLSFLHGNWYLLLIVAIIIYLILKLSESSSSSIEASELVELNNSGNAILIDIRETIEETIVTATQCSNIDKIKQTLRKNSKKTIVLICNKGKTAATMVNKLETQFDNIKYLSGGIQAWKQQGLPVLQQKSSI